jgi:hypothetical protein
VRPSAKKKLSRTPSNVTAANNPEARDACAVMGRSLAIIGCPDAAVALASASSRTAEGCDLTSAIIDRYLVLSK